MSAAKRQNIALQSSLIRVILDLGKCDLWEMFCQQTSPMDGLKPTVTLSTFRQEGKWTPYKRGHKELWTKRTDNMTYSFFCHNRRTSPNVSATPIGQIGLKMGWFPLGNGVCLIIKKAPSDSPIWQLKKRELLLPLSFLITKPIKLDLSNLHYGPHYEPHYGIQGCVIPENNITTPVTNPITEPKVAWLQKITLQPPLQTPFRTPLRTPRLRD